MMNSIEGALARRPRSLYFGGSLPLRTARILRNKETKRLALSRRRCLCQHGSAANGRGF
jgi:hypothetical protein